MYRIEICSEQQALVFEPALAEQIVCKVLESEQVAAAEISVAVVDNRTIHRLNRQHLQHDYPTDVLSFLLDRTDAEAGAGNPPASSGLRGLGSTLSGEVIVSAEMACQMADEYDWSPEAELALYLVHGVLHLCGYDDLTESEQQLMRRRECDILRHWQWVPRYASDASSTTDGTPAIEEQPC